MCTSDADLSPEAVEVGHEALHCQLGVDRGLEVEHRGVGVLRDSLEHLGPANGLVVDMDRHIHFLVKRF